MGWGVLYKGVLTRKDVFTKKLLILSIFQEVFLSTETVEYCLTIVEGNAQYLWTQEGYNISQLSKRGLDKK
jgi:hypothetical protein